MKIVGIIPARFGSTRFPGKPLKLLQGKPLLLWVIEIVQKSKLLNDFYVATDNVEIGNLCKKNNIKFIMTSETAATGTDRIYEACQNLKNNNITFDYVINIQGDEPLLPLEYIELLAEAFIQEPQLEMVTMAHPLSEIDIENKNAVKVLINKNNHAIYFSRFPIPFSREKFEHNDLVQKHIGLYGYRFDFLEKFCTHPQSFIEKSESLEQLRALDMGAKIKIISVEQSTHGVDVPEDLIKIENILLASNLVNNLANNFKKAQGKI